MSYCEYTLIQHPIPFFLPDLKLVMMLPKFPSGSQANSSPIIAHSCQVHTSHSVNCGISFAHGFYLSNLLNPSFTVSPAWDILAHTDAYFSCLTLPSVILWAVLGKGSTMVVGRTFVNLVGDLNLLTWLATDDDSEDIGAIKIYNVASS